MSVHGLSWRLLLQWSVSDRADQAVDEFSTTMGAVRTLVVLVQLAPTLPLTLLRTRGCKLPGSCV